MKIAYISQSYPPMISGAAIIAQRMAEQMVQRGHQVLVLAASERPYPYSVQQTDLTVKKVPSIRNPFRVGQRFTLWPHRTIMLALHDFAPDVIHSHDPLQLALSGMWYGHRKGVPVVFTIHQLPWFIEAYLPQWSLLTTLIDKSLWLYCRWLVRRSNALVAPTHTVANVVRAKTGCAPHEISCGIDPAFFQSEALSSENDAVLRLKLGIPPNVPILLHVGRLDLDKQVELLIQAAALAMQDHPAHLLIVGDGTQRSRLEALCHELGIGERSHFPGFITVLEGLPDLYRLASVFITASEIETQGLVLQEAQACSLPVVAFNSACIPEVVLDGVHGWLVPPKDVKGLAACIKRILEDPARARAMGQAGRQFAQKFESAHSLNAYEEIYRQAILQVKSPIPATHN